MDTQMKIRFEIKHKIDEASSLLCQKPLEVRKFKSNFGAF